MSGFQRTTDVFKELCETSVVQKHTTDPESIAAFESILNRALPSDATETTQYNLIKAMFYNNKNGFFRYISNDHNGVAPLVLWTESMYITKFFKLYSVVHIKWNEETLSYNVNQYVPFNQRPGFSQQPTDAANASANAPNTDASADASAASNVDTSAASNVVSTDEKTIVGGKVDYDPTSTNVNSNVSSLPVRAPTQDVRVINTRTERGGFRGRGGFRVRGRGGFYVRGGSRIDGSNTYSTANNRFTSGRNETRGRGNFRGRVRVQARGQSNTYGAVQNNARYNAQQSSVRSADQAAVQSNDQPNDQSNDRFGDRSWADQSEVAV